MKNKISKPNVYSLEKIEKLRLETLKNIEKDLKIFYFSFAIALIMPIIISIYKETAGYMSVTFVILIISGLNKPKILFKEKTETFSYAIFVFSIFLTVPIIGFLYMYNMWYILILSIFLLPYSIRNFKMLCWQEIALYQTKEFKKAFKYKYLQPRLKQLGYTYYPNSFISNQDFYVSKLYVGTLIGGNDKIIGNKDGVNFTFSDIVVQFGSQEQPLEEKSLFFCADLNKKVSIISKTFCFSDSSPHDLTGTGRLEFDNIEFNKTFKIYTNRPKNAWYILTPLLMQQLLELRKIVGCPINVSFTGSKIYIAILTGFDSFEPDINQSVLMHNPTHYIEQDLNKIFEIIETLRLNRKIWSVEK